MKKNFLKKVVGFVSLLAVTLTSSALPAVYAEDYVPEDEEIVFDSVEEYIEYSIPRHLYSRSMMFDGNVGYSEPVALYDFERNVVIGSEIFILNDDEIIGKEEVYDTAGGYMSIFDTYIPDCISLAYEDSEPIAMGFLGEGTFMYSDSEGYVQIDGIEENRPLMLSSPLELSVISVARETPAYLDVPYSHLHTVMLDVKHVPNNKQTYIFPQGLCWAACLAMKLNYSQDRYNSNTLDVLDAYMVANKCFEIGNYKPKDGVLTVYLEHELYMYKEYEYPYIEYTEEPMTHLEIHDCLNQGWPLVMAINKLPLEPNAVGHDMLITGIILETGSSTYYVDDPNIPQLRTFNFSGNPSKTFSDFYYEYKDEYGNVITYYNNWRHTYY